MTQVLSGCAVRAAAQRSRDGGALFNRGGTHRHSLWRRWASGPRVLWVCLNPSTAGKPPAEDQTTRKIRGFSERWGYGSYMLVNLFDYCSTDPRCLYDSRLPTLSTPENFACIMAAARDCEIVVCAWGRHGSLRGQALKFLQFMKERSMAATLRILRMNVDGSPAHPLMLPYTCKPTLYREELWPKK